MRAAVPLLLRPVVSALSSPGSLSSVGCCLACSALVLSISACTKADLSQSQRSFSRSGATAFVCLDVDADHDPGRSIDECPDFESSDEDHDLFALVTQTLHGEVAVVNLDRSRIEDSDALIPGLTFLPVGPQPVDIVATPGGTASFVATAGGPDQNGIYALPSSCILAPEEGEAQRDIVSWPSCSLPAAPGRMQILIDPPNGDGEVRAGCAGELRVMGDGGGTPTCEADLSLETQPPGRRVLAVTLPDLGELWLIDAQALLNTTPGKFAPCPVADGQKVALDASPLEPRPAPVLPADLDGECTPEPIAQGWGTQTFRSRPSDVDLADNVLYVGDLGAPLIHRLDVSDPCEITRQPPLLPGAYEDPGRAVFTSALAISPVTTRNERFVYAVDDQAGSVMIFDVSPGSAQRTPVLRPGSPLLPFEVPDRISFAAPAKDVAFVFRDLPEPDPVTGVARSGVLCDPDPSLASEYPAAAYRTSEDFSEGAGPRRLRGTFGMVALTNGTVAVIDVEDFDAPCRRPITTNPTAEEDFQGCANDPKVPEGYYLTPQGEPTVSGEQSCRVVEPHRTRSSSYFISSPASGIGAPSLQTFPQLRGANGASLASNQSETGLEHPKLLAVDFANGAPAEVRVGSTRYSSADDDHRLQVDPTEAETNGLAFVLREPRAFFPTDEGAAIYEGSLFGVRPAAFLELDGDESWLSDADGSFCSRGVEDVDLARERGEALGVDSGRLAEFAAWHADYVQIVAEIPDEDDVYWDQQQCGGENQFFECEQLFGTPEEPQTLRDLRIEAAYQGRLRVTPRGVDSAEERADILRQIDCCFGGEALSYVVRGGKQWIVQSMALGFQHHVAADPADDYRCHQDCNPRRALLDSRAFEIADERHLDAPENGNIEACRRGEGECLACVLDEPGPVPSDSPCVYQGLTTRFAIYRGQKRSDRDMAFGWSYSGGFRPLSATIAQTTSSVLPQRMEFMPQIQDLVVTDGASQGLVFVSLDTLSVRRYFY